MNASDKLEILKELLLTDEREYAESITKKLEVLEETVNKRNKLSPKVEPIIEDKLDEFVEEIPKTLGPTITAALKEEIANSQDSVVEALYPIMGRMIKRYVQSEIQKLREQLTQQINSRYTIKGIKRRLKAKSLGINESDLMLYEQGAPKIHQMFVIEKGSGIIKASLNKDQTIDQDMIAGMLTAIKSFVEDAFQTDEQELQLIEYDLYTIHIQNFSEYYIAVVISGVFDVSHRSKLEDLLLKFAQYKINKTDLHNQQHFSNKLKAYFTNDYI
ncbi:cell envelope biogenesis protein OmpA [Spongiivirga sp. MCCC 1A20706]|uniref:cell envelope biogenesis protein OmpA n=1 Tax=Spongiivirga sp. MCCC 1A20706 TaxID=3160963 RepID=UPI003977BA22